MDDLSDGAPAPARNPVTRNLLASAGMLVAMLVPAVAHGQQADEGDGGEPIVVIGTSRSDVKVLDSTSPVDVVSADRLALTGKTNLLDALQTILPSVNFPAGANSGNEAWNGKAISLRGLNPNYTLVLVNGKRYHPTSVVKTVGSYDQGAQTVDINTIPISAVERVEVLRDGASALYGSDAVAGVVNIVLRHADGGGGFTAQIGAYDGDGFRKDISGWTGVALPGEGFLTVGGDFSWQNGLDSFGPDTRRYYAAGDPREADVDRYIPLMGSPKRTQGRIFANGEIGLSDSLRAYGFANYARRRSIASLGPLLPNSTSNVVAIYPDGSQAKTRATSEDINVQLGLKYDAGTLGAFDLSAVYGRNSSKRWNFDTINPSLGTGSPTSFFISEFRNSQVNVQLDYSNDIAVGYADAPLTVALGVGYRRERWQSFAGDRASYIDGGIPILTGPSAGLPAAIGAYPGGNQGLSPSDVARLGRRVLSVYASVEQQVTRKLTLGVAGRAEDYSDFGSSLTGKASARYDFSDSFAVRGTINTGVRAPSLGQLGLSTRQVVYVNGGQTEGLFTPVSSPIAQLLGATALKPEKSLNFSGGFVWRPARRASLTVDAYQLKIDDAIVYSGLLSGSYVSSILGAAGYGQVRSVNYFTNAIDSRVRGVDVTANYVPFESSTARTGLSLAWGFHDTNITAVRNNQVLAAAGLEVFNRVARRTHEDGAPRSKIVASLDQTYLDWSLNLNVARYGSYIVANAANAANDQTIDGQWITDLAVSYAISPAWKVTVGAQNLFDSMPDKLNSFNKVLDFLPYSSTFGTPTDLGGRYLYASVGVSF